MNTKNTILLLLTIFLLNSCAGQPDGGTTTGNPLVAIEFQPYNQSFASKIQKLFIKEAYAGVNNLNFCFKRIRFKSSDSDLGQDVELELGEILIKPEGTPLGNVAIGEGTYKRVEFDLEKDCDGTTKGSVTLTNDNGTFISQDRITIRFEGEFNPASEDLSMFVQNFINVLKNYQSSDGKIKDVLENVSGTF